MTTPSDDRVDRCADRVGEVDAGVQHAPAVPEVRGEDALRRHHVERLLQSRLALSALLRERHARWRVPRCAAAAFAAGCTVDHLHAAAVLPPGPPFSDDALAASTVSVLGCRRGWRPRARPRRPRRRPSPRSAGGPWPRWSAACGAAHRAAGSETSVTSERCGAARPRGRRSAAAARRWRAASRTGVRSSVSWRSSSSGAAAPALRCRTASRL